MTLSLAQDAIAFLIDLAERGEIDPWDVNVINVIDRFLNELAPASAKGNPYETTLSQSGQAFLYASMLVLLKAESLTQTESTESDTDAQDEVEFFDPQGLGESALPPFLEKQLRRRAVAQPPKRRQVTLKELIDQLQTIAAALEDKTPRVRLHRPRPHSRSQAIRTIAQLAHQENLSEMAVALEQFFADHWSKITLGQEWLDFDLLLEFWLQIKASTGGVTPPSTEKGSKKSEPDPSSLTPHPSPNHDRVGVFWALLLLSAQSKVELAQEEFYQDLKIRLLSEQSISELANSSAFASPD
ncbi:segregation/condensation protein A [Kovacikia minuta CCNUW1]|uniref:segregation/condensation protein A n=1 Tax=Kovacikia minuta TaxID=2931930 RepID=UPI001CC9D768|nr:ScpA family protein [Kovacikia minuta]UBF28645.1 segregation/condensation protein A [Kovacikia minuta CCNUW1]